MRLIIEETYDLLSEWAGNYVAARINEAKPTAEHPFILGCVLALITLRCNSILPAMILHFLNNAYHVVSSYFDLSVPEAYYQTILMAGIVMFFVGLFYFLFIDRKYTYKKQISATPFLRGALPGIVFCTVVWLLVFLTNNVYFFPQIAE